MLDRVEGERVGEKEGGEGEKLERRKLWWSRRKGGGENGEGEGKGQLEGVREITAVFFNQMTVSNWNLP